jgi:hypothetical protein
MEEELIDPLLLNGHRPLFFLKALFWSFSSSSSLLHEIFNGVWVKSIHHFVKELSFGITLITNGALDIWKIVSKFIQSIYHLRINNLDCELRPSGNVPRGDIFLFECLLFARQNILNVLKSTSLQRRHQYSN